MDSEDATSDWAQAGTLGIGDHDPYQIAMSVPYFASAAQIPTISYPSCFRKLLLCAFRAKLDLKEQTVWA